MEIKNKVALISGGASGMGAQTAKHLAQAGAKVALLDFNKAAAEALADEIGAQAFHCDVSDATSAEAAMQAVIESFGEIHIGINCAGICPAARIVGREGVMPLADFSKVIQVNLIGTFNIMRLMAAQMSVQAIQNEDDERGVIINTASVAAYEGQIGQAAYSASKGGVVAMTLPAARELSRVGIRVMVIAPGLVATPMMASLPEKVQQSLAETVPFPKRLAHAVEFAALAQHIIENNYLNGSVIRLDAALRMSA